VLQLDWQVTPQGWTRCGTDAEKTGYWRGIYSVKCMASGRVRIALLSIATLTAAAASNARAADENWKGPGWYRVFDDGQGIVMTWSGPYPNEAACTSYVQKKFADPAYVQSMTVKYGDPKVWSFGCPYLEKDLPD
jgi:hypothetical protein